MKKLKGSGYLQRLDSGTGQELGGKDAGPLTAGRCPLTAMLLQDVAWGRMAATKARDIAKAAVAAGANTKEVRQK